MVIADVKECQQLSLVSPCSAARTSRGTIIEVT